MDVRTTQSTGYTVCVHLPIRTLITWHYPHSPAAAAARRAAIHRYLLRAGRMLTHARPDRQTDGRTDTVPLRRHCFVYTGWAKNKLLYCDGGVARW